MPQATNITVKNGASTPVDKTFILVTPAAGDGGIAAWALKEGPISSVFPTITVSAHRTTNKSRKLALKFRLPSSYNDAVTGLTLVGSAAEVNISVSMPDTFPEALKNDFAAFAANIVGNPLIKELIHDAYPAT